MPSSTSSQLLGRFDQDSVTIARLCDRGTGFFSRPPTATGFVAKSKLWATPCLNRSGFSGGAGDFPVGCGVGCEAFGEEPAYHF